VQRAQREGIPVFVLNGVTHPEPADLDSAMVVTLQQHAVDWVVLAGYMKKIGAMVLSRYAGRIINIHPALLPEFGGQGMYGRRVHEAVLAAGVAETGVTVHLVDGEYDHGEILAQTRVPVQTDDTVDVLASRVLQREHEFLVETIAGLGRRFQG
jgi:phosphoribosylglycinamide formyltransferase-1